MQNVSTRRQVVWQNYWRGKLPAWSKNIKPIRHMGFPSTADKLCQFIRSCSWMSSCIPHLDHISQPLRHILEKAYTSCGKRRMQALKKAALMRLSWGAIQKAAFTKLKETLKSAEKLAHLKDNHIISIFGDVSDKFWAECLCQFVTQMVYMTQGV